MSEPLIGSFVLRKREFSPRMSNDNLTMVASIEKYSPETLKSDKNYSYFGGPEEILDPSRPYGDGRVTTLSLFEKELGSGPSKAQGLGAWPDPSEDDLDVMLALVFHRYEHDSEFRERLHGTQNSDRLLFKQPRRGRRAWGVAFDKEGFARGENRYGDMLRDLRTVMQESR